MRPLIEELARLAPVAVSVYPNAGCLILCCRLGSRRLPSVLLQNQDGAESGWLNLVVAVAPPQIIFKPCDGPLNPSPRSIEPRMRLSGLDALTVSRASNLQYWGTH